MSLQSKREVEVTRRKIQQLEQLYSETQANSSLSDYSRELTLRSLRQTVNQLKEEVARFEAHSASSTEE